MNNELKKAIVNFIFDNEKVFNLNNYVTDKFTRYIYDEKGEYLIGGKDVSDFIDNAIKLLSA